MRRSRTSFALATAAGLILMGGCATGSDRAPTSRAPGDELIGRALRLETAAGQVSMLHFAEDGIVEAEFGGRTVKGSWIVAASRLCFSWAGTSRECWPYIAPLPRGETVRLTSDRGNQVRVTLQ